MSYRGSSVLRVPQDTILRLESAINGYSDGTVTFNIKVNGLHEMYKDELTNHVEEHFQLNP